jgi:hypothetical protein
MEKAGLAQTADRWNAKPASKVNNMVVEVESNAVKGAAGEHGLQIIG